MQYIAETKEFQITEPTVVSIGKFDGLHVGHQKLVGEMVRWKEKGLKVAMFTFSTPPLSLVGGRKQTVLMTNRERMELLRSAGVDYLVEYPFDQEVCHMAPEQFVKEILAGKMNARVIITGPDCHFGYKAAGDRALLEKLAPEYGYQFFVVEKERDTDGAIISSTYVRKMLEEGDVKKADRLLGYDYFITGTVTHGRSIGHKKLYPTANLIPPPEKHLPRFGVYVTRVTADGKTYGGLTNIGKKPTIQGENPVGVETYLYDFDGDLYGKEIRVELLDFIRPEMRFDSIGQLKAQLDHDIGKCREIFRDSWTAQEKGKADG